MLTVGQFVADTIKLGTIGDREGYDLTVSYGDPSNSEKFSKEFATGAAELSFDYNYFFRAGFEVDFFATAGNVNVIAPIVASLDTPTEVEAGGVFALKTQDWSFGESVVVASGPSFELGVAWIAPYRATPGGQQKFSNFAIEATLSLGAVFKMPLRQTEGFVRSLMQIMGLDLPVPDHTTLARRRRTVEVEMHAPGRKAPVDLVRR